ncbi:serine protease 28-like isoform X2 [Styela clava]
MGAAKKNHYIMASMGLLFAASCFGIAAYYFVSTIGSDTESSGINRNASYNQTQITYQERGVHDFLFGYLPEMDSGRIRDKPDKRLADYLTYQCGGKYVEDQKLKGNKGCSNTFPWLVSIAILNPNYSDASMAPRDLAQRNRKIRNNETAIRRVIGVCGGVLIATNWVLTAHHCVSKYRYLKVVVYGRDNIENVTGVRNFVSEIQSVYFYPHYDDVTNQHDIALLKLRGDIATTYCVQSACLPNYNVIPNTGERCQYAGWRVRIKSGNLTTATRFNYESVTQLTNAPLRQFNVTIEDPTNCQRKYRRLKYDVNYNICDTDTKINKTTSFLYRAKHPCSGYSGGPLMCFENNRWVVYGIVNWGEESCDGGRGYALVSTRIKWICCITRLQIKHCQQFRCSVDKK